MSSFRRPESFVPFDRSRVERIYSRNLPHWRQDGCTYFVTFRLADSIPENVHRQWEQEKRDWLERHGIAYDGEQCGWYEAFHRLPPREQFRFEQHFNRQVQSCLDRGLGGCFLREPECVAKVREEMMRDDGRRYHLGDYVIMPNHVHLLITPVVDDDNGERSSFRFFELEHILKSIKGASAAACNRLLGRSGTFWQADSYDHIVRSLEQLLAYRNYIAQNPVTGCAELPEKAHHRADWMDAWFGSASST